jgi:hypothetical protein
LHNCAKATENRQVFRDINALEILAPFLKSEDSEIAITALLTMSYITEDNQNHLLEADTKVSVRGVHVHGDDVYVHVDVVAVTGLSAILPIAKSTFS